MDDFSDLLNDSFPVPEVAEHVIQWRKTGSRVICDPPPADTDDDYVVLVSDLNRFLGALDGVGFGLDGSVPNCPLNAFVFVSMTLGKTNLISTQNEDFYKRFCAATHVAKKLNLLKKEDRVSLFQAVLYGNER